MPTRSSGVTRWPSRVPSASVNCQDSRALALMEARGCARPRLAARRASDGGSAASAASSASRRELERGQAARLEPVEARRVFEQRRVAARAHRGDDAAHRDLHRVVLRRFVARQRLERRVEARVVRAQPAQLHRAALRRAGARVRPTAAAAAKASISGCSVVALHLQRGLVDHQARRHRHRPLPRRPGCWRAGSVRSRPGRRSRRPGRRSARAPSSRRGG